MSNNYFLKSGRIILIIAIVIVTVSIICAYIRNTSDRLYFSITQFDLPERKLFNIGKNSDVCYAGVPENYMSVEYKDGGFSYKINHTDSCLYYKINNKNPNSHIFSENSTVRIFGINYQAKDVINFLKDFKNEYFMLNDVLAVVDTNWTTSVHHQAITSGDSYFNSFLYRKGGKGAFSIIILDKHTILNDTIRYCDASEHLSNSQQSAELKQSLKNTEFKIQFFKMKSWSTKRQKKGYLYNNERSYFAKSEQMFTEWGAGHILIKRNENNFSVTFPKAITTTIARKKVEETIKASQVGVYLKQMLKSYPMPTDFYIPDFSNALSEYVCELTPDKLIFQESNKRDTVTLQTSGSIIPQIDIKDQTLELGKIRYKARILNASFYWSKHYVLFLVWLVLAGILFLAFPVSGTEKVKDVRYYITGMFTLFWFFLNQKLLIAEKLTFTYPYFEKIYPVSYLTNLFSLFAVFLLILLINKVYFKVVKSNEKGFKNNDYLRWKFSSKRRFLKKWNAKLIVNFDSWFWKTVLVGGIIATCYFAVNKININFISPIWSSYLSGEISIFNPLSDAMNDNHFTVCLMAGALLGILLILFAMPSKWLTFVSPTKGQKLLEYKKRYWAYVIAFIAISFVIIYVLGGNFGTALAILILLYSLSFVMQQYTEKIPNNEDRYEYFIKWKSKNNNKFCWELAWFKYNLLKHKLWLWIISTLTLCCAFVGIGLSDFGFFINVFGIGITWIILIFCCAKHNATIGSLNNKILNTNFIAGLLLGIALVFTVGYLYVSHNSNPENIDYGRSTRRIQNCIEPDRVKEAGYLYTESDIQWMEAMRYYAEKTDKDMKDIYSEDNNFHQLVSSGQSPVILNDVCVPGVYIGSLRAWAWLSLLFGVVALGLLVYWFSIYDCWRNKDIKDNNKKFTINRRLIGQLLACNLWIGVTLYLLVSYYWCVPFTGRLIPGFGVDAVGEALEIIVLFAFMCALCNPFKNRTNLQSDN